MAEFLNQNKKYYIYWENIIWISMNHSHDTINTMRIRWVMSQLWWIARYEVSDVTRREISHMTKVGTWHSIWLWTFGQIWANMDFKLSSSLILWSLSIALWELCRCENLLGSEKWWTWFCSEVMVAKSLNLVKNGVN